MNFMVEQLYKYLTQKNIFCEAARDSEKNMNRLLLRDGIITYEKNVFHYKTYSGNPIIKKKNIFFDDCHVLQTGDIMLYNKKGFVGCIA